MLLTFRAKLVAIVATAALAQLLLLLASAAIARRVEHQLSAVQQRYLPKMDLEPRLDGAFERLWRGFEDAVAAHDSEALAATRPLRDRFVDQLDAAHGAVDPIAASTLRDAFQDYDRAAYDVSRRLIADETGEALVAAISAMQAKQTRVQTALKDATAFERRQLGEAFAAVAQADSAAKSYRLAISIGCLVAVVGLSTWLGRSVLRSLADLAAGLREFGTGEFGQPIRVEGHDELADVARQANAMANNLERLGRQHREAEEALQLSNRELEAFSYSVAHDLRAPLRGINGFSQALVEDYADRLDPVAKDYLQRICAGAERMGQLIDALLALSRVTRVELQRENVSLSQLADSIVKQLRAIHPDRVVEFVNEADLVVFGDPPLLRAVLENLLGNAWKFTSGRAFARIEFGSTRDQGASTYYVRDNGAGFDMAYADKLFAPFQRLHKVSEFAGTGIGLATVQRIVRRHGGKIWAEGAVNQGATFRFTLTSVAGETFS
jgi:signal transduction histidine kinase